MKIKTQITKNSVTKTLQSLLTCLIPLFKRLFLRTKGLLGKTNGLLRKTNGLLRTNGLLKPNGLLGFITPLSVVLVFALITSKIVATDEGSGTLSPPTGFCQARTYDEGITCSGNTFVARTLANLNDYNSRSGLVSGEYKDLAVAFAMTGETVQVHSPCKIKLRANLIHTAKNVCLSSKKAVEIYENSIFNSEKIHILPEEGISISRSSVLSGSELEIFSPDQVHINKGVRLDFSGGVRIISTATDQRIRFGPGTQINSGDLTIIGHEIVNFADTLVTNTGNITIESRGTGSRNRVGFFENTSVKGKNITILGGNQMIARSSTSFRASVNLHAQALGCVLSSGVTLQGASSSGSCVGESFNQIPTAIASATPRTGNIPLTVSFDASLSSDPDGTIDSYSWEFPDGTTLTGATVSREFTEAGSFTVKLTVTDNDGASQEAEVVINARKLLVSPTASATYTPQRGDAPLTVSFDGSGSSDPDGTIQSYEWIFTDGEILTGETAQRVFDRAGQYRFSLKVTDDDGLTHQTQEFVINVSEPNRPPVMVGDQTFEVKENKVMDIALSGATDPDGNLLTYEIVNAPSSGTLTDCLGGTNDLNCVYTPESDFTGTVIFSYKANDGRRDSETVSMVTLNVISYNKRPIANAGSDENALSGTMVTLDGSLSSDPESQPLTYSWTLSDKPLLSRAQLANPNSVNPNFIVDKNGTYTVRLIVNDGKLNSPPDEVEITVTRETNTPPVLDSITTPQNIPIGTELRFTISGSDADTQDEIRFLSPNLPANASLNGGTGEFRFKPVLSQVGPHTVTFQVTDGKDITSQGVMLIVQPADENQVTALSSRVIDANSFSDGQTVPLAGVKVSVLGSSVTTTTDAQGRFTLSGIPHGSQIITLDASAVTGTTHSYANFNGRLNILQNVLNRPSRDYMLPRMSTGTTVIPTQTTTVSNTNIGVTLTIPRNTAMNQDGTMFSGTLSIDMVPTDATPRELPEEFSPSFIITIQPTGVRFANPVPITFPNTDNLPAGSVVELFSLSEQGGFESVGYGQVSSNGQSITTLTGGVRSASWHFTTVIEPRLEKIGPPNSDDGENNNEDPAMCDGSLICATSGSLGEEHELPGFVSQGVPIAMKMGFKNPQALEFNPMLFRVVYVTRQVRVNPNDPNSRSLTINPRPVPRMTVRASINGSNSPMTSFDTSDVLNRPNEPFSLIKNVDLHGMDTGIHTVGLSVGLGASTSGGGSRVMKKSVNYPVISPDTEFGMGWRFEGLQKLYGMNGPVSSTSDKIMLVYGNFKFLVFTRNTDGTYTSPDGDYSTLSFIPEPFGGYSRTTKNGTTYVFDRHGKLAGFLDRYNRRTTYIYDTNNKLTQIIYSNGGSTVFAYGTDGYIDTITDPMMRVTSFTHDSTGHITQIIDSDNTTRSFDYGPDHRLLSQTDKLQRAKNYGYDKMGNVVQVIRPDNTQVELVSKVTKLSSKSSDSNMVVIDNDSKFSNFMDSNGNTTKIDTNAFGAVMKTIDPMGQTVSYERDDDNNITQRTDKRGNNVTRGYDAMGNLTSFSDELSRSYSYGYMTNPEDNFHQITSSTDGEGNRTTYTYDTKGNLTRIAMPNSRSTSFTYTGYLMTSMTRTGDTSDVSSYFEHDSNGNVSIVRDSGRRIVSQRTYDNAGNVLTSTDALGNVTTYTYDNLNRLKTQTDARGGVVTYAYDNMGNLTSITDERNHITSFEYDGMDRLVKITDPRLFTEEFDYDANGNLLEKTDKNENIITSQYDVLNRLENNIFPDGTSESFTYDPNNNLLTATDSDSDLLFTYDNSNRLTQASTVNSRTVPNVNITYTYDDNDNMKSVHDSVTSSTKQILYDYDDSNRLTKMGHSSDTDPSAIRFTYSKLDQRIKTLYPNGVVSSYLYTPGKPNRLRTLSHTKTTTPLNEDGTQGETTTTTHSSFTYSYNLNDYVTGLSTTRSEITVNSSLTYGYDTTNQLTSATKPQGTGAETFTYDLSGNRLRKDAETVDSTFSERNELKNDKTYTYVYDKNGNLTKKTHITTGEITTYTWDYKNQLTSVTVKPNATAEPTSEVSYRYDALGRRIQKNVDDTITNYVYDRSNILLEFNASNILEAKYVHSDRTDEVMMMERPRSPHTSESFANQRYYYHHDRLGSTTEITNLIGDVIQRYVYDSFGNTSLYNKDGTAITESSTDYLKNPFTFTGRERDPETGLQYHRARYYDTIAGRWISSDPIAFDSGDTNLYRYAENNSLNYTDTDGLRVARCRRRIHYSPIKIGSISHSFLCVTTIDEEGKSTTVCGGFGKDGPTSPEVDNPNTCTEETEVPPPDNNQDCFDRCVRRRITSNDRPPYDPINKNCHDYVNDVISICHLNCAD